MKRTTLQNTQLIGSHVYFLSKPLTIFEAIIHSIPAWAASRLRHQPDSYLWSTFALIIEMGFRILVVKAIWWDSVAGIEIAIMVAILTPSPSPPSPSGFFEPNAMTASVLFDIEVDLSIRDVTPLRFSFGIDSKCRKEQFLVSSGNVDKGACSRLDSSYSFDPIDRPIR